MLILRNRVFIQHRERAYANYIGKVVSDKIVNDVWDTFQEPRSVWSVIRRIRDPLQSALHRYRFR